MKSIKRFAAGIVCLGCGLAQLNALPVAHPLYQDIDMLGSITHGAILSPGDSVKGEFGIVTADSTPSWTVWGNLPNAGKTYTDVVGYQPGVDPAITQARAFFYVASLDREEVIDISLAGGDFLGGSGYKAWVLFDGELSVDLLVTLSETGTLEYEIANAGTAGRFAVKAAQLQVTVPDGGTTVALLGSALLGLGALRRRYFV